MTVKCIAATIVVLIALCAPLCAGVTFSDTFIDTSQTLLTDHTPEVQYDGLGWRYIDGNAKISPNENEVVTVSDSGLVVFEGGEADGVLTANFGTGTTGTTGQFLIFRATDANNYWAIVHKPSDGLQRLRRVISGSSTDVDSYNIPGYTEGDAVSYAVTCSGTSISVEVDGAAAVMTTTDSHNETASLHGLSVTTGPWLDIEFDAETVTLADDALTVGVFRDGLRASTGNDTFTSVGLGSAIKQRGAFVWGTAATSADDGTAVDNAIWSYGCGMSPTRRFWLSGRVNDNDTTDAEGHMEDDDAIYALINPTSESLTAKADFDDYVTDGVQVDVTDAPAAEMFLHGLLFSGSGVRAATETFIASRTLDASVELTVPFEPDLVILFTNGDQFNGSTTHGGFLGFTVCFCTNDKAGTVEHASISIAQTAQSGTAANYGAVSNTYMQFVDPIRDNSAVDATYELSFPDANTARLTTRNPSNDTTDPEIGALFIDTNGTEVNVGIADSPTSTGVQAISLGSGIQPKTVMMLCSQITTLDTFTQGAAAGTLGIASASTSGTQAENYAGVMNENGVSTTNSKSISDDQIFHMLDDDGGPSGDLVGAFDSFSANAVNVNFSAVGGSAYKLPYLAIGEAGGGTTIPIFLHHYRQQSR